MIGSPKHILTFGALVVTSLVALSFVPNSQAETSVKSELKRCVSSPGMETTLLSDTQILARNGNAAVLIEIEGCRPSPFDQLIFEYRGSSQICGPMDVQIYSYVGNGFKSACFITSVTPISKDEAKTLSKQKYKRSES
jgi:hypothetical protein